MFAFSIFSHINTRTVVQCVCTDTSSIQTPLAIMASLRRSPNVLNPESPEKNPGLKHRHNLTVSEKFRSSLLGIGCHFGVFTKKIDELLQGRGVVRVSLKA